MFQGLFFYLNWITQVEQQHNFSVQSSLSETLQILLDLKTLAFMQKDTKCESGTDGAVPQPPPPPPKNKDEFTVADRGFWKGLGATKGHMFDAPLAKAIVSFFQEENVRFAKILQNF